MIFYDLLWCFEDSDEINKKEKDKTIVIVAKPPSKIVWGGYLNGFRKSRG
jgi:hypothetical protein